MFSRNRLNSSGVYAIKNKVNSHSYIGQSIELSRRWEQHKKELRRGIHCNKHLQHAWNKYGEKNFFFEVIEFCKLDQLEEKEQYWIINLSPEYNQVLYIGNDEWVSKETEMDVKKKYKVVYTDNQSDIRCVGCNEYYELLPGASTERCFSCNQKYLKQVQEGKRDSWHRYVYGGARKGDDKKT